MVLGIYVLYKVSFSIIIYNNPYNSKQFKIVDTQLYQYYYVGMKVKKYGHPYFDKV